jgi:hypothetical protein
MNKSDQCKGNIAQEKAEIEIDDVGSITCLACKITIYTADNFVSDQIDEIRLLNENKPIHL